MSTSIRVSSDRLQAALLAFFCGLFPLSGLSAATIAVAPGAVNRLPDGVCSLIEAIENANGGPPTHTDCAAGDLGPDTLQLAASSDYVVDRVDNPYYGPTGLPPIASDITIEGRGSTIRRGAAIPFRLFFVAKGDEVDSAHAPSLLRAGSLKLVELTLANGFAKGGNGGNGGIGGGGGGAGLGGAIFNRGSLTVSRSTIQGNRAEGGQGGHISTGGASAGGGGGGLGGDGGNFGGGGGGMSGNGGNGCCGGPAVAGGGGGGFGGDGGDGDDDGGGGNGGGGGGRDTDGDDGGFGKDGGGNGGHHSGDPPPGGAGGYFGGGGGGGFYPGGGWSPDPECGNGGWGGWGGGGGGASWEPGDDPVCPGGWGHIGGGGGGTEAAAGGSGGWGGGGGAPGGSSVFGGGGAAFGPGDSAGFGGDGEHFGSRRGGGGAGLGGAIFNLNGTVTVFNSTLSGNVAAGGAGFTHGKGRGSAIFNYHGKLDVSWSTIADNDGDGAVYSYYAEPAPGGFGGNTSTRIEYSILANTRNGFDCISFDLTSSIVVQNSIIRSQSDGGSGETFCFDPASPPASSSTGDPQLEPLARNGGPTATHALPDTSPAREAGGEACGSGDNATDQRGKLRRNTVGTAPARCDLGAYELQRSDFELADLAMDRAFLPTSSSLKVSGEIRNLGPSRAGAIRLELVKEPAAAVFPDDIPGCKDPLEIDGNSLFCELEDVLLENGGSESFELTLTAPPTAGPMSLRARIAGHSSDETAPANDARTVGALVDGDDPLLTVSFPSDNPVFGVVGPFVSLRGLVHDGGAVISGIEKVTWSLAGAAGAAPVTGIVAPAETGTPGVVFSRWLAARIPLKEGAANQITLTVTDRAGRSRHQPLTINSVKSENLVAELTLGGSPIDLQAGGELVNPVGLSLHGSLEVAETRLYLNGVSIAAAPGSSLSHSVDLAGLPATEAPFDAGNAGYFLSAGALLRDGRLVSWPLEVPIGLAASSLPAVAGEQVSSLWHALPPVAGLAPGEEFRDLAAGTGSEVWAITSTAPRMALAQSQEVVDEVVRHLREEIATADGRLRRWDGAAWHSFAPGDFGHPALPSDFFFTAVAVDGETLWIGTSRGLIKARTAAPTTVEAFYAADIAAPYDGPAGSFITALHLADDGHLWIGHRGSRFYQLQANANSSSKKYWRDFGGVSRLAGGVFTQYRSQQASDGSTDASGSADWQTVAGTAVTSIATAGEAVFVGSEEGLSILRNGFWRRENDQVSGLPFRAIDTVSAAEVAVPVAGGEQNQIWVWAGGRDGAAFLRLTPPAGPLPGVPAQSGSWSHFAAGLPAVEVRDLHVDRHSRLVSIATDGGVALYDPQSTRLLAQTAAGEAGAGRAGVLAGAGNGRVWAGVSLAGAAGQGRVAMVDPSLGVPLAAPLPGARFATGPDGVAEVGLEWTPVDGASGYEVFLDGRMVGRGVLPGRELALAPGDYAWTVRALYAGDSAAGPSSLPRTFRVLDGSGPVEFLVLAADGRVTGLFRPDAGAAAEAPSLRFSPFAPFSSSLAAHASGSLSSVLTPTGAPLTHPAGQAISGFGAGAWRVDVTSEEDGLIFGNPADGALKVWEGSLRLARGRQVAGLRDVAGLADGRFAALVGGQEVQVFARQEAHQEIDLVETIALGLGPSPDGATAIAGLPAGGFVLLAFGQVRVYDFDPAQGKHSLAGLLELAGVAGAGAGDIAVDGQGRIFVLDGDEVAFAHDLAARSGSPVAVDPGWTRQTLTAADNHSLATFASLGGRSAIPNLDYTPPETPPAGAEDFDTDEFPSGTTVYQADQDTWIEGFLHSAGPVDESGGILAGSTDLYLELDPHRFPAFERLFPNRLKIAGGAWTLDTRTGEIGDAEDQLEIPGLGTVTVEGLRLLGVGELAESTSLSGVMIAGTLALGPADAGATRFDHLFLADFGGEFVVTFGEEGLPGLKDPFRQGHLAFPGYPLLIGVSGGGGDGVHPHFPRAEVTLCTAGEPDEDFSCVLEALSLEISGLELGPDQAVFGATTTALLDNSFTLEIGSGSFTGEGLKAIGIELSTPTNPDPLPIGGLWIDAEGLEFTGEILRDLSGFQADLTGLSLGWDEDGQVNDYFSLESAQVSLGAGLVVHFGDVQFPFGFFDLPIREFPIPGDVVVLHGEGAEDCEISCPDTECGEDAKINFKIELCGATGFKLSDQEIAIPAFSLIVPYKKTADENYSFRFGGARITPDFIELSDPGEIDLFGASWDFEQVRLGTGGFFAKKAQVSLGAAENAGSEDPPSLSVTLRDFEIGADPLRLGLGGGGFERYGFGFDIARQDEESNCVFPIGGEPGPEDPVFDVAIKGIPFIDELSGAIEITSNPTRLALRCLNPPTEIKIGPLEVSDLLLGRLPEPLPFWAQDQHGHSRWEDPLAFGGRFKFGNSPEVGAWAVLDDGRLDFLRGEVQFAPPGIAIATEVYLQRLEAELKIRDWEVAGRATFSVGQQLKIPVLMPEPVYPIAVDGGIKISSAGYVRVDVGVTMLKMFEVAEAELIMGNVYLKGALAGRGVYFRGSTNLFAGFLNVGARAFFYFDRKTYGGELEGTVAVPKYVPVIGGYHFGGASLNLDGRYDPAKITFHGQVAIEVLFTFHAGFRIDSDDGVDAWLKDRPAAAAAQPARRAFDRGYHRRGLSLLTDFAALESKELALASGQTKSRQVSYFTVDRDAPTAVVRLDYSQVASGEASLTLEFPDGTLHTAGNTRAFFPPDPNAGQPAAGDLPIGYRQAEYAGAPAHPGDPDAEPPVAPRDAEPPLKEAVFFFSGPLAFQPAPVHGPDGEGSGEFVDRLLPTPVPRGLYKVIVETEGMADGASGLVEVLLGNNPPRVETKNVAVHGDHRYGMTWQVADQDRDEVKVSLHLSADRDQPNMGFPIGNEEGYPAYLGQGGGSETIDLCSPDIREQNFTGSLHFFLGLDDGRAPRSYHYLESASPCLAADAPPQVEGVVAVARDGGAEIYWQPLQWNPPPGVELASYVAIAEEIGVPGTASRLPLSVGVPLPRRGSADPASQAFVFNEIHADPDPVLLGDANRDGAIDGGDRFVELYNDTGRAVELAGYSLHGGAGELHRFAAGTVVPDRCALVLFGGGDFAAAGRGSFGNALVRAAAGLALAPQGDTLVLRDSGGATVAQAAYGGGDRQALTREPQLTGAWVAHGLAEGSAERVHSPGTFAGGGNFVGCAAIGQAVFEGLENGRDYRIVVSAIAEKAITTGAPICTCQLRDQVVEANDTGHYCHPLFELPADPGQLAMLPFDPATNALPLPCGVPSQADNVEILGGEPSAPLILAVRADAGGNNAPSIVSAPATVVEIGAGNLWSYLLRAEDADGDPLTLAVSSGDPAFGERPLPAPGIQVTPDPAQPNASGEWLLTFAPGSDPAALGRFPVQLLVRDQESEAVQKLRLEVVHFGQTPSAAELTSSAPRTAYLGQTYSYRMAVVSTPADLEPRFFLRKGPAGMSIGAADGVVRWVPSPADLASSPVTVVLEVYDPEPGCAPDCTLASEAFELEVLADPLAGVPGYPLLAVTPAASDLPVAGGSLQLRIENLGGAGSSLAFTVDIVDDGGGMLRRVSGTPAGGLASSSPIFYPLEALPNPGRLARRAIVEVTAVNPAGDAPVLGNPRRVTISQAAQAAEVIVLSPAATGISKAAQTVAVGVRNGNPSPGQMTWAATVVEGGAYVTLGNGNQTNFAGETKSFQAQFAENHVGPRSARIRVVSSQAQNSPQEIVITQASSSADLSIAQMGDPFRVQIGNNVAYTIAVTNNDPVNAAVGVLVTDHLPAQLAFEATTTVEGFASCLNNPVGYQVCNLGDLAPGQTKKYRLIARAVTEATVTNLAVVSAQTPDPNGANNSAQAQTVLTRGADLSLQKSAPAEVYAGELLTYGLELSNLGLADATGVTLTDTLPAGVVFVSASGGCSHDGSPQGGIVTCGLAALANGATATRSIVVRVKSETRGTLTNSATASTTDQPDPAPANNTGTADTLVEASADLEISQADDSTTAVPGQRIRYRLVVKNNGPSTAEDALVSDLFPPQLVDVSYSSVATGPASGNAATGIGAIADVVDLGVGASVTYTVWARIAPSAAGTLTNLATVAVTAGDRDPDPADNSSTDDNSLTPEGDLAVTKTDGLSSVVPGTGLTYTLRVTNAVERPGALYFGADSTGRLYRLDPATAAPTLLGPSGATTATVGLSEGFDAARLFGSRPVGLQHVASDGSGATLAGNTEIEGLAFDPVKGTLYYSKDGAFGTLHPETGAVLSALASPGGDLEALAFGHGGVYGLQRLDTRLHFFDPALGTWSVVGNTSQAWTNAGLAFDPASDRLYAKHRTDTLLYAIDPLTAATTAVGDTGLLTGGGLAFVAPEGISDAAAAQLTDSFPAAFGQASWTCVASPGSACQGGSGSALGELVSVAAFGSVTYTITGQVDPAARGELVNTATVAAPPGFTDFSPGNNQATDSDQLTPQVDLTLSKVYQPARVIAGAAAGNLVAVVTMTNHGPSDATGLVVADVSSLPAGVILDSVTPSGDTTWSAPSWTLGHLPVGASRTLTLVQTAGPSAAEGAVVSNTAAVAAVNEPRIHPGDDQVTAAAQVTRRVDLALEIDESIDPVAAGSGSGNLRYVVEARNHGPSDASGVRVQATLTLPAGASLDSATPSTGSYSAGSWIVGTLARGAEAGLTLVLTVGPQAAHQAIVRLEAAIAGSNEIRIDPEDDAAVEETLVIDAAPPTVTVHADGPLEDCHLLNAGLPALQAVFSEPMFDPPGDDAGGDVTNKSSYLLLRTGPDRDFATETCGPVQGDDLPLRIEGVTYDPPTRTATLSLDHRAMVRSGYYRLLLCGSTPSLKDAAGNALDGNADGRAGDDFLRSYRIDQASHLRNGHFDCKTQPWVATDPDAVGFDQEDSDGSGLSGSAGLEIGPASGQGISQCTAVEAGARYRLSHRVKVDFTAGSQAREVESCGAHADAQCAGQPIATYLRQRQLTENGGAWRPFSSILTLPPEAVAISCALMSMMDQPGGQATLLFDEVLLEAILFADGFESGDTSAWQP